MINRNVAHLDKTLFFSCSWQKVDIQVGKYSECVTIIPDDLTGVTYWLCFHIGTQTTLQMIVTEEKKSIFRLAVHQRDIRAIPKNDSYQRTHKHGCSLNGTLRNIVEGDISIAWPLAGCSPSLPFCIYTLINLSEIKKPNISLFKWISSFCGILRLIEGILCGIHQDNCRPMQHCSRLHVYLLQSP